jgi:molybdopterin-guanine dinucleotide biosynthesis protein A
VSVVAIVLAGGASSRFGGDKLAATLDGRPLLHHALGAAAAVAPRIVLVLAPGVAVPALPVELVGRIAVARDAVANEGPLAGIAAGLAASAPAGDPAPDVLAIVVAGDMPSLRPAVLRLLLDRLAGDDTLAAATLEADPPAPLPVALRIGAARPVAAALLAEGRRAIRGLFDRVPLTVVPATEWHALDPAGATLRDVDRRRDLGHP